MRILVMTQFFWPETFRVNDLVEELIARGHDVTILTGLPNYPDGDIFEEYRREPQRFSKFHGAPVLRVPVIGRGRSSKRLLLNYLSYVLSASTLGVWRLRRHKFDAIFVSMSSPITAVLPAILQRRLKRAKLIVWVLDLWPETLSAVDVVRSPVILGWIGRLVSYIYRRTDHILVQSKAFFPNIERYGGQEAKVDYFPAWAEPIFEVDPAFVEKAPEMMPYQDTFNVLFAGNIGEAQDFPAILDAVEKLRNHTYIRFFVLGDGRAVDWLKKEIVQRGLDERIILLGRYPIERMPSFFRAADALLVSLKAAPIFSMTIPGKVQSYMAAGVPLLGMLDGEGARVINEAGAGLTCAAGDAEGLATLAQELSALSIADRRSMGEKARAYCRREFDRETLVSLFETWLAVS
ncbi:glycosyltransferase family 4 protein [Mesorhizobium retamae]|uniref:Glycosyltransferase family 4 protein n=1 Tax=Mesorhizobium retamae TaxID=2912854 RepID=A0ABS9QFQ5_9HYPH|nr:glycosyltransferase family 4 protein [Mesorhizobium sp. IRAMC:0171]MCG7506268.1 glycosyltransferase family 4 protein [Mesorhizobium sp. IRAMC:0171]